VPGSNHSTVSRRNEVAPARSSKGGGPTAHDPAEGLNPSQVAVLELQRTVGNRAVTNAGPHQALAIQRGIFDRLRGKSPKPPPKTHEKTSATEMTSAEGANELMRVKDEVQKWLDLRDKLVSKGTAPDAAARMAFSQAPDHVKRYLPLHSEFDVVKREIDQARTVEGGIKQGKIGAGLEQHAKQHGYTQGVGDPMQAKPKDVEKELKEDQAFRRQLERRAERLLLGDREAASLELETAQESNNKAAILAAKKKLAALHGEKAVQDKLFEIALDAKVAIDQLTLTKIEEHKKALGVPRLSDAEKWRLREKAKATVRSQLEAGLDTSLADAGKVTGTIASVGSKVVKVGGRAAKPLTTSLTASQKTTFKGVLGSVGEGLKSVGGLFSSAVKLAGKVADRDSDKLDADANIEIAFEALKIVKQAATAARGTLKVIQTFDSTLGRDPGFMAAVPGLSIFAGTIGFVGNCVAVVPPADRLWSTTDAEKAAKDGGNEPLATALKRTLTENKIQVTTEITGAVANGIRISAAIIELVTAGGLGIPAAVKGASYALEGAKKVADFVALETLRGQTQEARKQGALQVEGSGKKLIKTDISYAIDTIILAAKKALQKEAARKPLTPEEQRLIGLLGAYGFQGREAGRLGMGELHERMLEKLDQDDEQATLKMKLEAGLEAAKKALADLAGGEKEKEYQDLDTYAKEQEAEANAEANKTTGDKVKEGLSTAGGYVKTIVTAPLKITKLGEMASEKSEKVKRLREIKNLTNYKDRSDRGRGFAVKEFGADLTESIAKLRKWIVATQPPDKAALYLKELNTLGEQTKITKKIGQQKATDARASTEKPTDRVISPALFSKGESLTFEQVRTLLTNPDLGKADREYLRYLLAQKAYKVA
jgi:ribosomal protein L13E